MTVTIHDSIVRVLSNDKKNVKKYFNKLLNKVQRGDLTWDHLAKAIISSTKHTVTHAQNTEPLIRSRELIGLIKGSIADSSQSNSLKKRVKKLQDLEDALSTLEHDEDKVTSFSEYYNHMNRLQNERVSWGYGDAVYADYTRVVVVAVIIGIIWFFTLRD